MADPTLSLCMIARNEKGRIERCLTSAADHVDEIIVVDTGSSDDTPSIARSMGATVIEEPWQEDFSWHRNTSINHAQGDWILFLDCDEELAPGSGEQIRQAIADTPCEAFILPVNNRANTSKGELTAFSMRLFRNKGYRFRGRIHEQIAVEIIEAKGYEAVDRLGAPIIHHGYDPSQVNIPAKIRRNLSILEAYPEEEKDGFYYYNLGTEYFRSGDLSKALEIFQKALPLTKPSSSFGPMLVKRGVSILIDQEAYHDALQQIDYYLQIYPRFTDLVFIQGIAYGFCGRYSQAVAALQKHLAMAPPPPLFPVETEVVGKTAQDYLHEFSYLATGKAEPGLSVVVIGRDEGERLHDCIVSVAEIAKQLIYVDTGSTDGSPQRARQLGAEVYTLPWPGDYAQVRNFALKQASQPWILVLDSDEILSEEGAKNLVQALPNLKADGCRLRVRTFLDDRKSLDNCFDRPSIRLFRNAGYPYHRAVGEAIAPAISESGGLLTTLDILILHSQGPISPEHRQNKIIWQKEAIANLRTVEPIKADRCAGLLACRTGNWEEAIPYLQAIPQSQRDEEIWLFLGLALYRCNRSQEAAALFDEGCRLYPRWTELAYLRGLAAFAEKAYAKAEICFEQCLYFGNSPWEETITIPGTGAYKAWLALGQSAAHLADGAKAAAAFLTVSSYPEGREGAVRGLASIEEHLAEPLLDYLEHYGLAQSHDLSVAAQALAGAKKWRLSFELLRKSLTTLNQEGEAKDYSPWLTGIHTLLATLQQSFAAPQNSPIP